MWEGSMVKERKRRREEAKTLLNYILSFSGRYSMSLRVFPILWFSMALLFAAAWLPGGVGWLAMTIFLARYTNSAYLLAGRRQKE